MLKYFVLFCVFVIQKVRTELFRSFQRLLHLPILNQFRIAAEKHIRNFPSVEFHRARINRRGNQAVLEAVGSLTL